MAEAYRRVISLPEGTSDRAAAQLEERLVAAVEAQRELAAKSPHVLRFLGNLQKGAGAYFVEHEPAELALPPDQLFSPNAQAAPAERLMQMAAAMFHALATAHKSQAQQTRAHGALCPGVILVTTDGIEKVTDFGFAPAICAALGPDNYLNLAVGPPNPPVGGEGRGETSEDATVTGVWEVLSPDEFDREDRICAFVDPEKYGTSILEGFEPGSDIIAAGFILHLMAEHQHPYLAEDPDAHRMVDMSSMMDAMRYNNARRQDLRESSDEGVRLWCDLVAKMLARLPHGRPSADEVLTALSKYVKPVDAAEILRRRLDAQIQQVKPTPSEQVDWNLVRREVQSITDSEAANDDLRSRAAPILAEASGRVMLDNALRLIQGDHWAEAKEPLEEILGLPDLPTDLVTPAREAFATLENYIAVGSELEAIEARSLPDGEMGPEATRTLAQELLAQTEQLPSDEDLPESLRARRSSLRSQIQVQLEEATAEVEKLEEQKRLEAERLERERQADLQAAEDWLTTIRTALETQQWADLRTALDARPDLKHWPSDAETRTAAVAKELEAYEAEQRRLAAVEADAKKAQHWMNQLKEAVEKQAWNQAESALQQRPKLKHWPADIVELDRKLTAEVKEFRKKEADAQVARNWFEQLDEAVRSENWQEAGNALAREPALDFWPAEIQQQLSKYRKQIEERLEAAELERRRAEEARRQVQEWLAKARQEADAQDWEQAFETLRSPPLVEPFPEELRTEADELQASFAKKIEEARAALKNRRIREFQSYAVILVRGLVEKPLGRFLNSELLEISLGDIEFDPPEALDRAQALLSVGVRNTDAASGETPFEHRCEFQMAGDAPELRGDPEDLGSQITAYLRDILAGRQKARAADLFQQLRHGMFPDIKIHARLDELAERLKVRAELCGPKSKNGDVETELVWSPDTLAWNHDDPTSFVRGALKIATEATRQVAESHVIEQSQQLSRYRSRLVVALEPKPPASPDAFPKSVEMEAHLSFQPHNNVSPVTLQTIPSKSEKLGELSLEASLAPAEAKLGELVVEAQNHSRAVLEDSVDQRIKSAAVKIKMVASPKRLKTPQDELRFELKARGGRTLNVTPRWDCDSLEFVLPGDWDNNLGAFLEAAPSSSQRRGLGLPIAIAAVIAVVVGGVWAGMNAGKGDGGEKIVAGPSDSDGDGVTDEFDRCAGTPPGTRVDTRGCPAEKPPEDTDGDGVTDDLDRCPNTSHGVAVDDEGCEIEKPPRDTDGDGVTDDADQCPQTPTGASVDESGCRIEEPPRDSDGDGVTDDLDRCPGTDTGIAVNDAGCPRQTTDTEDAGKAAEAARRILVESGLFNEIDAAPLVIETSTRDHARLLISVPGLAEGNDIELSEKDTEGAWALSDQQRQALADQLSELGELLELNRPLSISSALPAAIDPRFTDFVDPSTLKLNIGLRSDWLFIDGAWLSSTDNATVSIDENDPDPVSVDGVELVLKPVNGIMTVSDELDRAAGAVREAVRQRLLKLLARSLEQAKQYLSVALTANRTGAEDAVIEVAPLTDLAVQVELIATWPGMRHRTYAARWNKSERAFDFGNQFPAHADQDTLAHEILWSINQVISDDYWIRRASADPVTELHAPDNTAWVLSVPAPWPVDDETPNREFAGRLPIVLDLSQVNWLDPQEEPQDLARRILGRGLTQPSYWPLVEAYLYARGGDPAFGLLMKDASDAALQPLIRAPSASAGWLEVMRSNVIPFWRRARFVQPEVSLSEGPAQVTASEAGPEVLQFQVHGHWGLANLPDEPAAMMTSEGWAKLGDGVRQLFEPRTCMVTLTIKDGELSPSWSDGGELIQGFAETWQFAETLDVQLASLPARRQLEQSLEQRIATAPTADQVVASIPVDEATAWRVLQDIWGAKGVQEGAGEDLSALTARLRNQLGGRGAMVPIKKRAKIAPTVFGEYFTGPRYTYAVVWSAPPGGGAIAEGPVLLRLCETDLLLSETGHASLGEVLFDPVFGAVADACAARTTPDVDFEKQLGIVLAPDGAMSLHDLATLPLTPVDTDLEPTARRGGKRADIYQWASLADLESTLKDRLCGSYLYRTLTVPEKWQPVAGEQREAESWAAKMLADALDRAD